MVRRDLTPRRRTLWAATLITALLLIARLAGAPALFDPAGGTLPDGVRLRYPPLYLMLGPLFSLWDQVSMLDIDRLRGWLVGLGLLFLIWRLAVIRGRRRRLPGLPWVLWRRDGLRLLLAIAALALFIVGGALWHRPMAALTGAPPSTIVADLHSHTNASHDVKGTLMGGFDAEANRRWHARAGFEAAFITDHNTTAGLPAMPSGASVAPGSGTVLCPGEEVSAGPGHIVVLGVTSPVDRSEFPPTYPGLLALLHDKDSLRSALTIASLPEYREHLWPRLPELVRAGLDGFEIVNAAPRADALSPIERDSVIRLARDNDEFLAGVSDNHGWGATSMVWNLVAGTPPVPPPARCGAVLDRLRSGGFGAIQIAERRHLTRESLWPEWLTPLGVVWETWRTMGWALTASWLVWIWAGALVAARGR